tara:strand:- start:60 stop:980 length:921 start_codon:yes stop_codon:yes gene_type:complete
MNKKIFICEYVTGGGYINKKIPKSLFQQAKAIVKSLLHDFNKIPNLKIIYTLDYKYKRFEKFKNVKCIYVKKNFRKVWISLIKKTDVFFPIAPESRNKLISLIKLNKYSKKILSNSEKAIIKTGNKYKTYKFFKKNSIPTIETFNNKKINFNIAKSWVVKPKDGAGSEKSYIFKNNEKLKEFLISNKNFIVQPLIKGDSYSANIITLNKKIFVLNFNKQKVLYNKNKIIFKGTNFRKKIPCEKRVKKYINKIYKKIPGLNSFFGIDFIISKKKIYFLEINPRITTSYINISKKLKINPAKIILKSL